MTETEGYRHSKRGKKTIVKIIITRFVVEFRRNGFLKQDMYKSKHAASLTGDLALLFSSNA